MRLPRLQLEPEKPSRRGIGAGNEESPLRLPPRFQHRQALRVALYALVEPVQQVHCPM